LIEAEELFQGVGDKKEATASSGKPSVFAMVKSIEDHFRRSF
jgi:hypothetical protein